MSKFVPLYSDDDEKKRLGEAFIDDEGQAFGQMDGGTVFIGMMEIEPE